MRAAQPLFCRRAMAAGSAIVIVKRFAFARVCRVEMLLIVTAIILGAAGGAALLRTVGRRYLRREGARGDRLLAEGAAVVTHRLAAARADATLVTMEREREAQASVRQARRELDQREADLLEEEYGINARAQRQESLATALQQASELANGAHLECERLGAKRRVAETKAVVRLEERGGLTLIDAREQRCTAVVGSFELRLQKTLRARETQLREAASGVAERLMATVADRYAGEGHVERVQNTIPFADRSTLDVLADPAGLAHRAFIDVVGCSLVAEQEGLAIRGDDPLAREIARRVLRQLANRASADADVVRKIAAQVTDEVRREVHNAARKAARTLDVGMVHPEVLELVGRLRFRLSYSQNQWKHAVEVGFLAGMLAEEMGLDARLARRGGLLHDIGKALTHEREGSHAVLGAEVARRCDEDPIVANAIGSHHNDEPPETAIAHIVTAADAMSGARPGARRESSLAYDERLVAIQDIATAAHPAVQRVDIMQAGREVRVVVAGEEREVHGEIGSAPLIGDADLHPLAQSIARQLEENIAFAGQIRVTVIRESRSIAVAR